MSNLKRKCVESCKRKRQAEIIELKENREYKKRIGDVITSKDYHSSGHVRHGK